MHSEQTILSPLRAVVVLGLALFVGACATGPAGPGAATLTPPEQSAYDYVIGPGDQLDIFVWRNPELSQTVAVRPDGKISVPLVEDLVASGKTATQVAREIEGTLSTYVKEPLVTVIVANFQGVYNTQVRVVGEAAAPQALPYRDNMTALDVMIEVGGLTDFAAGNRARLVRTTGDEQQQAILRLEDLIKEGDISANVELAPGDVIIIPEAWF